MIQKHSIWISVPKLMYMYKHYNLLLHRELKYMDLLTPKLATFGLQKTGDSSGLAVVNGLIRRRSEKEIQPHQARH